MEPAAAVRRWLSPTTWPTPRHIYVVGAGKAGVAMARAVAARLGERLTAGVLSVPHAPAQSPARLTFVEGGHPQPTAGTLTAGRAIADLLAPATQRDLVLALISGGGSALLELLRPGLTLADLQQTTAVLLRSGAAIHEINVVRTQLSQIKGGGLARLAAPGARAGTHPVGRGGQPTGRASRSGPTVVGLGRTTRPRRWRSWIGTSCARSCRRRSASGLAARHRPAGRRARRGWRTG